MHFPHLPTKTPSTYSDEIEDDPAKLRLTELTSLGIRVRDYAYPSDCIPAPYTNMPAHPLPPGLSESNVYFDPRVAFADYEFRIQRNTNLAIDGQKARWLFDLGWLTERDKVRWREKDLDALHEYDSFVADKREKGRPTVSFVIPRTCRSWRGPGPPPPDVDEKEERNEKQLRGCVIA